MEWKTNNEGVKVKTSKLKKINEAEGQGKNRTKGVHYEI
jgi:hypothetical protein